MFIKRMSKLTTKAKEELERLREEDRTTTERLIEVFTDVLQTNTEADSAETAGASICKVLDDAGGTVRLLEQCEHVSAHQGYALRPYRLALWGQCGRVGSHRDSLAGFAARGHFHPGGQGIALDTASEADHLQSQKSSLPGIPCPGDSRAHVFPAHVHRG